MYILRATRYLINCQIKNPGYNKNDYLQMIQPECAYNN